MEADLAPKGIRLLWHQDHLRRDGVQRGGREAQVRQRQGRETPPMDRKVSAQSFQRKNLDFCLALLVNKACLQF